MVVYTNKAWEFLLFARPRFEAFALPGIVERATQRPHAGYVTPIFFTPERREDMI